MTLSRKILTAVALSVPLLSFAAPTATSLDGSFALKPDADVFESGTVKHTTVWGSVSSDNPVAWFSFTGQAGQSLWADHDDGISGDTLTDSVLSLFDASGRLLAWGDDGNADSGSVDNGGVTFNAFLGVYTLPTSGVYYLAVSSVGNTPNDTGCSFAASLVQPGTENFTGSAYSGCSAESFSFVNGDTPDGNFTVHVSLTEGVAAVPEPASLPLAALALAGLMVRRRRR